MRCVRKAVALRSRKGRSQAGFTLVEFLVAFVISTLIMVGAVTIMQYMVVRAAENGHRTMSQINAYYVGFWIGEDVVQAQIIDVPDDPPDPNGFPLLLKWTGSGGNVSIGYYFDAGKGTMTREHKVNEVLDGNVTIAEYLLPWSESEQEGTRCQRSGNLLVLEVVADYDRGDKMPAVQSRYEILPRFSMVTWQ